MNHEPLTVNRQTVKPYTFVPVLCISTTVEDSLQIDPFMQNKPNFLNAQMNVNKVLTKDYENKTLGGCGKNKPNSNPISPPPRQNKPISNPNKPNFKRDLAKMGHHEAVKCVDTALQFTLNLTKNSNSVQNNDKAKK